jgi:hypothetical protein
LLIIVCELLIKASLPKEYFNTAASHTSGVIVIGHVVIYTRSTGLALCFVVVGFFSHLPTKSKGTLGLHSVCQSGKSIFSMFYCSCFQIFI